MKFQGITRIAAAILLIQSSLWLSYPACAQTVSPPRIIRAIKLEVRNIFDPSESTLQAASTLLNALHIATREDVIRNELLFAIGDTLNPSLLYETERNLRAFRFLKHVSIAVDSTWADSLTVIVTTRDRWSLTLYAEANFENSAQTYGLGLYEDNLLGLGKNCSIMFSRLTNQIPRDQMELSFYDPRILGSRWGGGYSYQSLQEGKLHQIKLERLYFSDGTRWAAAASITGGTTYRLFFREGVAVERYAIETYAAKGWFSFAFGEEPLVRATVGTINTYAHSAASVPADVRRPLDNANLLFASLACINRSYSTATGIDHLHVTEDIPAGWQALIGAGREIIRRIPEAPDGRVVAAMQWSDWAGRSAHFSVAGGSAAYWTDDRFHDISASLRGSGFLKPWNSDLLGFDIGWRGNFSRIGRRQELLGGAGQGLRGFKESQFGGVFACYINLEARHVWDASWWIFDFASFLFFDAGAVYDTPSALPHTQFHNSFGGGFHIENNTAPGGSVVSLVLARTSDAPHSVGIYLSSRFRIEFTHIFQFIPF